MIHNNNKSTNSFFWFHQHEPVADNNLVCTSPTSITKVILIQCATCQFYLVNSSLSYSIWTGCCMWSQIENVCVFVCSGNGFLLCHPRVTPWCAKLYGLLWWGSGRAGVPETKPRSHTCRTCFPACAPPSVSLCIPVMWTTAFFGF